MPPASTTQPTPPSPTHSSSSEDDYLSMALPTAPTAPESSLARTARLKRAAADRSQHQPSTTTTPDLETALATPIPSTSKGAQMLARMGFKGGGLGAVNGTQGRAEPIAVSMREDRSGVGMESERKRKVREEGERVAEREKRGKVSEGEYIERVRGEREERRVEGLVGAAARVAEELAGLGDEVLIGKVNVLWRGVVRRRVEGERERRLRGEMSRGFGRLVEVDDADDEEVEKAVEDEIDGTDEELEEFEALSAQERLDKLVAYLRTECFYCFWCKYRYPDETMDGCPGLTEDEHG